jgi:hypothetical protein
MAASGVSAPRLRERIPVVVQSPPTTSSGRAQDAIKNVPPTKRPHCRSRTTLRSISSQCRAPRCVTRQKCEALSSTTPLYQHEGADPPSLPASRSAVSTANNPQFPRKHWGELPGARPSNRQSSSLPRPIESVCVPCELLQIARVLELRAHWGTWQTLPGGLAWGCRRGGARPVVVRAHAVARLALRFFMSVVVQAAEPPGWL